VMSLLSSHFTRRQDMKSCKKKANQFNAKGN
jgi:hypothetical protein